MKDLRRWRIQGVEEWEAESTERYPLWENWSSNLDWNIVNQVEDKGLKKEKEESELKAEIQKRIEQAITAITSNSRSR